MTFLGGWAGGPALTILACTISTEGAPSLRCLQGWDHDAAESEPVKSENEGKLGQTGRSPYVENWGNVPSCRGFFMPRIGARKLFTGPY